MFYTMIRTDLYQGRIRDYTPLVQVSTNHTPLACTQNLPIILIIYKKYKSAYYVLPSIK